MNFSIHFSRLLDFRNECVHSVWVGVCVSTLYSCWSYGCECTENGCPFARPTFYFRIEVHLFDFYLSIYLFFSVGFGHESCHTTFARNFRNFIHPFVCVDNFDCSFRSLRILVENIMTKTNVQLSKVSTLIISLLLLYRLFFSFCARKCIGYI